MKEPSITAAEECGAGAAKPPKKYFRNDVGPIVAFFSPPPPFLGRLRATGCVRTERRRVATTLFSRALRCLRERKLHSRSAV